MNEHGTCAECGRCYWTAARICNHCKPHTASQRADLWTTPFGSFTYDEVVTAIAGAETWEDE